MKAGVGMKLKRNAALLLRLIAVAAVGMPSAPAADANLYAGFGVGRHVFPVSCAVPGVVISSCDDNDTSFKIFGGYEFNRNIGLEAGYVNLGKINVNGITFAGAPFGTDVKAKGLELVGVGIVPINDQFSAYGKWGVFRWNVDASGSIVGGGTGSVRSSGADFTYGFGVKYYFTKNIGARLELQRYQDVGDSATIGRSTINLLSVGVVGKF